FKTTDGGATWAQLPSTANSSWFSVNRIAINPNNSQIILAATSTGIYQSTDGGGSWILRNSTRMLDIDFNPVDGTKAIASGTNGWYDNIIWVDPANSNTVIVGGIDLWRGTYDGTNLTLTKISQWQSAPNSAHADNHIVVESSQFDGSTNKTVFFGNDGGIYR